MIKFGKKSQECFNEMHPSLQVVVATAAKNTPPEFDWSIVEAHRPVSRQKELYAAGATKLDGVTKKSEHNYYPSRAFDVYPWLKGFGTLIPNVECYRNLLKFTGKEITEANIHLAEKFVLSRMAVVSGILLAAAESHGIDLLWGTDWDRDGNFLDHTFQDYPHHQLVSLG